MAKSRNRNRNTNRKTNTPQASGMRAINTDRVYRQAAEFAEQLLADQENISNIFERALELVADGKDITLNGLYDIDSWSKTLLKAVAERCRSVDHDYFIPGLVEAFRRFYKDKNKESNTTLGMAIKVCLDFLWQNAYDRPAGSLSRSYNVVSDVISLCLLYTSFQGIRYAWEYHELNQMIVARDGIVQNAEYEKIARELMKQGRHEYKVVESASGAFWMDPVGFMKSVEAMISDPTITSGSFGANNFLSEVPATENRFWAKVWVRIALLFYVLEQQAKIKKDLDVGAIIVGAGAKKFVTAGRTPIVEDEFLKCVWDEPWHRSQDLGNYIDLEGMIPERPVIPVGQVFVTCPLMIADSLNLLLEEYIHLSRGPIYEKYFSKPFEEEVIQLFRMHGWKAGEVTSQGVWKHQSGHESFKALDKCPGQIDLLAVDEANKVVLVGDDKLLKFPMSSNTYRNLRNKVGDDDGEAYHAVLNEKLAWIKSATANKLKDYQFIKILITRRYVPQTMTGKHLVLSYEQLENCLEEKVSVNKWRKYAKDAFG